LTRIDYDTDVLVIGGGGAGAAAAIEAHNAGASVLLVTKLRMGEANTMMAEGGIQAADKANDSPLIHYLDAMGGGHFKNIPDLLEELVENGPLAIDWLSKLGVLFDKEPDGTMVTTHGGGTSRKRMHACKDVTGAEIMRVLRDETQNLGIPVLSYAPAVELLKDRTGRVAGAVLWDFDSQEFTVVRAKTVILATGGAGRLHYQGFPTSNHYGATADGLVLAYRAGAKLIYADAIQYHPTGVAFPAQIYGALVTEKVRSIGAQLVNSKGVAFMNPLETRDVAAASIIRECTARGNGVKALDGVALWLDTPVIDMLHGEGTVEKRIPGMLRMYQKFGIDIRKEPILVYPTLHYQNGGILINRDAETEIPGLFVAGEAVGGIHGTNRLMGNSLLDIIVFGRIAGEHAAAEAKQHDAAPAGSLNFDHVAAFAREREAAGIKATVLSPKLLPTYTHGRKAR
jgi:succinate dehydrogenase / fumarate reductase flavoprotein subunit